MEPFSILSLCAELAIGITGFAGVVLVFGERNEASASPLDHVLFRPLFTGTLIPLALIAIASVLEAYGIMPSAIWRLCSAIHVPAILAAASLNVRATGRTASVAGLRGDTVIIGGSVLVICLQLANAISIHEFWPFLIAVWWGIAVSLFAFVSLIFARRAA
jgi:hypothetical protein